MAEQHGIKETKEVLQALFAVTKVCAEIFKDGFQVQDLIDGFSKLNGDAEKKALLEAALKDVKAVPEEVKDISLAEGVELLVLVAQEVPALLEAFKKVEPVNA